MGFTSLQVCMDSSDWLQGTISDESSSPSGDMLACSRPLMERRLRPQHDHPLKCPRCDSTHTKFCYYNNYSLSQPRYFCKTCRRYWTKGGTLRNIPVGGGCRKNKKSSSKKPNNDPQHPIAVGSSLGPLPSPSPSPSSTTDLQLSHLSSLMGHGGLGGPGFMEAHTKPIDFMGSGEIGLMGGMEMGLGFNSLCSPFGVSLEGNAGAGSFMDSCHRLMLPYDQTNEEQGGVDVKPNGKLLALEWQDHSCSDAGKDSYGYLSSMGSWTGLMNGYGPSTTNPLV